MQKPNTPLTGKPFQQLTRNVPYPPTWNTRNT